MTATLTDLTARRLRGEQAVARMAAAPVRHVPAAFLAALECLDVSADLTAPTVAGLRAVSAGA